MGPPFLCQRLKFCGYRQYYDALRFINKSYFLFSWLMVVFLRQKELVRRLA